MKRIASEFGLELRFRIEIDGNKVIGRFVDLVERVGAWQGREVEFGKDLVGIERKEDTAKIVTALVGLGPTKEDGTRLEVFVEDLDALKRWGRNGAHLVEIYEPQSTDQDMTIERLTTLTQNELDKRVNSVVEYTAEVADLEHVPGLKNKKIRFGDTIKIKDTYFNPPLYLEARVHTQERSISDKSQKKVTLGDYIEYTEEQVKAIWKSLQAQIALKISMADVLEVTYTKPVIDDKDSITYQNSTLYADGLKAEIDQEIGDIQQSITNLDTYVDGAFSDGVIQQAEAKAIEKYINQLNVEKGDIDNKYTAIYTNSDLSGAPKTNLSSAKTAYNTAHTNLINSINAAIADGKTTSTEKTDVDTKFTAYNNALKTLSTRFEEAITAIAQSKSNTAEANAKGYADSLKATIDGEISDVNTAINDLDTYVDSSFKDGVIQEAEAKAIEKYLNQLSTEKADIDARYTDVYGNPLLIGTPKTDLSSKKSAYNTAHTNLINSINTAIADGKTTATEKADVDAKFTAYKTALSNLSTSFEKAIDAIAQAKANDAQANAINYTDKLSTKGLSMKVNYSTFTQANTGELYMHGYNSSGDPADVNGFLIVNGTKLTILKEMINPNVAGDGFIMWDNVTQHWYMVVISSSMVWTRYNAQDVTNHGLSFTPTTDHYFVGVVQSPSSEGTLVATLWNDYKEWTEVEKIVKGFYAESNAVNYADTTYSEAKSLVNGWKFTGKTTINGGQVEADTVTAVQVASRTLTAQKMVIADFTNLSGIDVENPPVSVYIAKYPDATSYHTDGYRYLKIGPNAYSKLNLASSKRVEFAVGDKYYLSFIGWKDTSTSVNFIIRYYYTDASWSNAGTGSITMSGSSSSPGFCEKVVSITAAPTANKTISYVDFFLEKANDTTYYYYARDIELRKMYGGNLIVDGSINANHIEANGIIGATIKTASSGARVELNSTGLKQYDLSGNVIVDMSGGNATFKGTVNTSENAVVGTDLTIGVGGEAGTQRKIIMGSNAQIQSTNNQADLTLSCNYVNIPTGYLMIGGQPSARAYINSNFSLTAGVWHTMPAAVKSHDLRGNNYSTTTYKFSCPVDGDYLISASIVATTTATAALDTIVLAVFKNGVFESKISYGSCYNGTVIQTGGSTVIRCLGSDDIEVRVTSSRAATMVNTANNPGNNFVAFALLH